MKISTLKKVPLREIWKNEAYDFTTWLSLPENLSLLSEEIGIDITLKETEASVGRYSLDILAEETDTDRKIIIENQLESTDHDHLGKVITYASGLEAEVMIWIVKDAREEHRKAVQWLNDYTDNKLNFFLLQIEAWQIGEQPLVGPRFNTICRPNNWSKALKERQSTDNMTDLKITKLDFWSGFKEYAEENNTKLRTTNRPRALHYYTFPAGSGACHFGAITHFSRNIVWFELYIKDNKELFYSLEAKKEPIESEMGTALVWEDCEGKGARIKLETEIEVDDPNNWPKAYQWYLKVGEKFQEVFSKHI